LPPYHLAVIRYSLSWGDPNEHLFDIELAFTAPADDPLLHLPAWRPGRYLIQNYAANVREWSPSMQKVAKSTWQVRARAGEAVTVRYRYYAGVLDAGSSFLDEDEAYFNGSNLFMWVDGLRDQPCELRIATEWPIQSQLLPGMTARDYDHLIDSPTVASPRMTVHSFEESGATIHLVFLLAEGLDTAQFVEPVRAIVRTQAELFGGLPLRDYRFLYHVTDRWHGVEHEDSCSITAKRADLLDVQPGEEGFDHFLSITAHELFHLWNVKRILPARFLPYDYSTETPTRLLWVMEGITSYYGERTLLLGGLWSEERYLDHLSEEIAVLENSPGRHVLSLAQASFDGWLQDPAHLHDKANAWISFYNKGEVVAAMLDLELRSRGRTLDDVVHQLWRDYGETGRGVEEDALERIAGPELNDFFTKYVEGTEPLPYAELLGRAGVSFHPRLRDASFGAGVRVIDGALIVERVVRGGAASAAGILAGDELLAIAGQRVRSEADVDRIVRALGKADCEVLTSRFGIVRTRPFAGRPDGGGDIEVAIDPTADESRHQFRREWLRRVE
jgi:predicted metalloprotease with PDZ domain